MTTEPLEAIIITSTANPLPQAKIAQLAQKAMNAKSLTFVDDMHLIETRPHEGREDITAHVYQGTGTRT